MSAPAGWHLQPDGQERYWDGTRWTDEFRAPLPSDPTAPPPAPEWAPSVDETQALDVESTRAIPAPATPQQSYPPQQWTQPDQAAPGPTPPPGQQPDPGQQYPQYSQQQYPQQYQQPGYQQSGYPQQYPQPGYPQTGYGAPGSQTYGPPPRQGSGLAKGCLIAAVIGLFVLGAVIAAVFVLANRAVDSVSRSLPSGFPTSLPTGLPTELPSGTGQSLTVSVGDGFDLPRAAVQRGWTLEASGGGGVPVVDVKGMKARLSGDEGLPVLFTMSVTGGSGESAETVCTASSGSSGGTVDVSCVPLFGDVADATEVTVTSTF